MPDYRVQAPNDWKTLPDGELVRLAIAEIWSSADLGEGYSGVRRVMAKRTAGQRALFATRWCDAEVDNGGFHQFFSNSTGMLCPEAVEGFQLLGMENCVKAVRAAITFFKLSPFSRDQDERLSRLENIKYDGDTAYEKVDKPFYEANGDLEAKQAAYIRAHPEEFFLP